MAVSAIVRTDNEWPRMSAGGPPARILNADASIERRRRKGEVLMKFTMKLVVSVLALGGLIVTLAAPAAATFPGKNGRIAFIQGPDVYTMNPDGSDVKQLTNLGPDNGVAWESWSPDGKQIVLNEYRSPDFLGQLWLTNADGSNQRLLFAEGELDE